MVKVSINLSKPIYAGFSILDLSKILMYDFYYNVMKKKFGNVQLLFTDTDLLCVGIDTEDIYSDMGKFSDYFDTSDYPTDHPLHSVKNKKVLGKFKDECNGDPIQSFVALRAKMYSIQTARQHKCTAKGIAKYVKKSLRHQDYIDCLQDRTRTRIYQRRIQSDLHNIYTINQSKIGLSPADDKRYILPNGIDTLAHGHRYCRNLNYYW